jgi:hypothetical protein
MAKANREEVLGRGEQLLKEWQAGDAVEALREVLGRDDAADLAIAERLGHLAQPEAVAVLQQLESTAADKLVRKEAKRSLYRLEQKGVAIPRVEAAAPRLVEVEPGIVGYLSAVDGNGDQLVWLTRSQSGVLLHAFAAINDPLGLKEIELAETTRRGLRALRTDMLERHGVRMFETDWRYCDFLIDRALRWAQERGHTGGDYPGVRARFTREPVQDCAGYIRDLLGAAAVAEDPDLLTQSEALLKEPELRALLLRPDELQSYIDAWMEIIDSPLVLSEEQQRERIAELAKKAVAELFGGEVQGSWVRRLEMLAYTFHVTGRLAEAKQALAAALALEKSGNGGEGVPVLEALTKACLAFYTQLAEQRRAGEKQEDPPVTPE